MTDRGQKTTLFMTVGGTPPPLQSALADVRPDKAFFIVSSGDGGTRSSENIVTDKTVTYTAGGQTKQTKGLRFCTGFPDDHYTIIKVPADDPGRALALIETHIAREHAAGAQVIADYTGGTKSMTAALVMAATAHEGVKLQFMVGKRDDLVRVKSGSEFAAQIPQDLMGLSQMFNTVRRLVHMRNYGAALQGLAPSIAAKAGNSCVKMPPAWSKRMEDWKCWITVLDMWDRFDHKKASHWLKQGAKGGQRWASVLYEHNLGQRLERLSQQAGSATPELVEDLWLNACRRAQLGQYDDAVARLYRLSEASVQARLKARFNVDTAKVPLDELSPELRDRQQPRINPRTGLPEAHVALGLEASIEHLKNLDASDTLVAMWAASQKQWRGRRNHSILAHGFTPLKEKDWSMAKQWFEDNKAVLWEDLLKRPTAEQLPNEIPPGL